jgi:CubicO group peptidase (beta-lactamase class C family)
LAKIGYLFLRDGMWEGRRLLPEGWVAMSTTRHVGSVGQGEWGYGYQWWLLERDGVPVWAGRGFGGQILLVLPAHQMVAVSNAWNVFGNRARSLLIPLVDAMLESVQP